MIELVAEAGINHIGDMKIAREMILRTKDVGCKVWKTQCYDVPSLFPKHEIMASGRNWYEEVLKTQLSFEQVLQIAEWCKDAELEFLCSVFDIERFRWVDPLVKRHKMASRATLIPDVVQAMLLTKKEVIISSGMIKQGGFVPPEDYEKWNEGSKPLRYLYCVADYPAKLEDLHLGRIKFPRPFWGFSDHSEGITAAKVAISRGARMIEKHVTLSKDFVGPDIAASITFGELRELVKFAREFEVIHG